MSTIKERIEKSSAQHTVRKIKENGFIRVAEPYAVRQKVKRILGIDLEVSGSKLSLKLNQMKKKKSTKKKGNSLVGKISRKAKAIRKPGEKWTNAIKRASKQLK